MARYRIETATGGLYDVDLAEGDDIESVVAQIEAEESSKARAPLPEGILPSSAGAGRGYAGGPTAEQVSGEPRRGGTRAEVKPYVAGSSDPARMELPAGVKPSAAGAGRGSVNPLNPKVSRADSDYKDKQDAINDAVDRIEQGMNPEKVFASFSKLGVGRDEIIARGVQLGGPAFVKDERQLTVRPGALDGQIDKRETGVVEDVANFGRRVGARASQAATGVLAQTGLMGSDFAAEVLAKDQRRIEAAAPGEEVQQQIERLGKVKEWGEVPGAIVQNPKGVLMMLAESVALTAPLLAASAARIGAAGMAGVAGASSGGIEYGSALADALADRGVSLTDVEQVSKLLKDDAFLADTRARAAKRGLAVGAFDALTAGLAGRFIEPALEAVRAGKLTGMAANKAVAGAWGKELGMQAAGGGAGEQLGQALTGEHKPLDVALEVLGEAASAPVEALANARDARAAKALADPATQFAGAFAQDAADVRFTQAGADARVNAAMRPDAARFVDPQQTVVRAEDMPTSVIEPSVLAAEMARADAVKAAQAPLAQEPTPDAVVKAEQATAPAGAELPDSGVKAEPVIHPVTGETVMPDDPRYAEVRRAKGLPEVSAQQVQPGAPGQEAAVSRPPAAPPISTPQPAVPEVDAASAPPAAGVAPGVPRVPSQLARAKEALKQNAANLPTDNQLTTDRTAVAQPDEDAKTRAELRAAGMTRAEKRAAELEALGRRTGSQKLIAEASSIRARGGLASAPVIGEPPAGPELSNANGLLSALAQVTGRRKGVAYWGAGKGKAFQDGFFDSKVGAFAVDINRPDLPVAFTVFHEFTHVIQDAAAKGDVKAKRAEELMGRIWDMITPEGKRTYAEKYLFKAQLQDPKVTVDQLLADPKKLATLRNEMLADFMGKRALDRRFLKKLAQRDPKNFGDFVREWIGLLGDLIAKIRGVKDVDQYLVGQLEEAKAIAEEALAGWVADNEQQAPEQKSAADEGVQNTARQAYEVAPDPNDKKATDDWNARPVEDRIEATYRVDDEVFPLIVKATGIETHSMGRTKTFGGYMGQTNPAVLRKGYGVSDADMMTLGKAVGYVYNQDSVLMLVDNPSDTSIESDLLRISLDKPLTYETAKAVYDAIRKDNDWIQGFTGQEKDIDIINVGGKITPAMIEGVRRSLEGAKIEGRATVHDVAATVHVEFIERGQYEGDDGSRGAEERGAAGRLPGDRAALAEARQRAAKLLGERATDTRGLRPEGAGGIRPHLRGAVGPRPARSYGAARQGAVGVDAFHFSQAPRRSLSSSFYGTGLKGSGAEVFKNAKDKRLGGRVYFYFNRGNGINPESGVGGHAHRVKLNNLYDSDVDPQNFRRGGPMTLEAQSKVLDAGFDGFLARGHNLSGVAVLLGKHDVPAEYIGQSGRFDGGEEAPPFGDNIWYSLRDKDELGAFNPFQNEVDYDESFSDEDYQIVDDEADRRVAKAEFDLEDIRAELEAEGYGVTGAPKIRMRAGGGDAVNFSDTTDAEIKAAGLMAENAYPDPVYREVAGDTVADVVVMGRPAEIVIRSEEDKKEKGSNPFMYPEALAKIGAKGKPGVSNPNFGSRDNPMGADKAKQLAKAFTASADLFHRGFDLHKAVKPAQAKRVLSSWKKIAKVSGAFEFAALPEALVGATQVERAQKVADTLLAGTRFTAKAAPALPVHGRESVELTIKDRKTGEFDSGVIEIRRRQKAQGGPYARMHSEGFTRGSAFGKPFYQVAFGLMDMLGDIPVEADTRLLGVNNYRRTEQQIAAASRSGKASVIHPGVGQRVYGWEDKAKTGPANDRNLTRLFLAGARNAAEFIPEVESLSYDLAADKFRWPDGSDAESFVKGALSNPDVRMVSISRSTLARAVVTFSAINGQLDLDSVDSIASPVLYSARAETDEYAGMSTGLGDGYSKLEGRKVSYQVRVADTGDIATLTAPAASALRNLDERIETMRSLLSCLNR